MIHRVFVYGTLLAGEPNHRLLRRSRLVGEATTADGFALHNLGPFPGMVRAKAGHVRGEVYEVDDATLAALDRLEGHPSFYRRTEIALDSGETVSTYLLRPAQVAGCPIIPTGRWRDRQPQETP